MGKKLISIIPKFINLTELYCNGGYHLFDDNWIKEISLNCNKLESIEIPGTACLSAQSLQFLLVNLKNLKRINIQPDLRSGFSYEEYCKLLGSHSHATKFTSLRFAFDYNNYINDTGLALLAQGAQLINLHMIEIERCIFSSIGLKYFLQIIFLH